MGVYSLFPPLQIGLPFVFCFYKRFWFGPDLVHGLHVVSFSGCLYICIIVVHYCITLLHYFIEIP